MVKRGKAFDCPADVYQCGSQRAKYIGFTFRDTKLTCQTKRYAQLTDARTDVANVTQNDADGLMSDRCFLGVRMPS
jgi:hypothetical protein